MITLPSLSDHYWVNHYTKAMSDIDFIRSEERNIGILSRWYQDVGRQFQIDGDVGCSDWWIWHDTVAKYRMMRIVRLYSRWLVEKKPLEAAELKAHLLWERGEIECKKEEKRIIAERNSYPFTFGAAGSGDFSSGSLTPLVPGPAAEGNTKNEVKT